MRSRRTLLLSGAAAVVVVAALLVVWVLARDDGGSGSDIAAAEVLPADAEILRYLDRDATAEQLDLGGDVDAYLQALSDASWAGTPLSADLAAMADAPFDERDVDWWASVEVGDAAPLNVYRIDDGVDLSDVADVLADAGLEESELDGNRRFKLSPDVEMDGSGLAAGIPVHELFDVTVLADEHLLVAGAEPERVVDVVEGDADALADNAGLSALTDRAGTPLYATAFLGTDAGCADQVDRGLGTASPDAAERFRSESGIDELGVPDARGLFVAAEDGDVRTVAVLEFGSDDEATADAGARTVWLEDGLDPVTLRGYSELLDTGGVEADGGLVVVDAGPDPGLAIQTSELGFGPLACAG